MSGSEEEHLVSLTFRKNEEDMDEDEGKVKQKEKPKEKQMEFVNQVRDLDFLSKNS